MNKIQRLLQSFGSHISVPWREGAAPPERVIFCVYDEVDELRLRAKIDEFELTTKRAGHEWLNFDLTDSFADWLVAQRYAVSYFNKPELIPNLYPRYLNYIREQFGQLVSNCDTLENSAVALTGVGSLFGIVKVKDVVDALAPMVSGRLVVFFPGSFEGNNYRLLDGYDGWNYLAIAITANKDF